MFSIGDKIIFIGCNTDGWDEEYKKIISSFFGKEGVVLSVFTEEKYDIDGKKFDCCISMPITNTNSFLLEFTEKIFCNFNEISFSKKNIILKFKPTH